MTTILEALNPDVVGKALLKLSPATNDVPRAFFPVDISLTLIDEAISRGLRLPLEMTVTAPSPANFYRHVFRRVVPSLVSFTPREGGEHLLVVREVGHNKWHGELVVVVVGDRTK